MNEIDLVGEVVVIFNNFYVATYQHGVRNPTESHLVGRVSCRISTEMYDHAICR
jgi:hypothetical protein